MSKTNISEIDTPDEAPEMSEIETSKRKRGGIGLGKVTALFVLASAGGGLGGYGMAKFAPPLTAQSPRATAQTLADLGLLKARVVKTETTLKQQAAGLSRLTAEMRAKPAVVSIGESGETSGSSVDLGAIDLASIQERLAALEANIKSAPPDAQLSPVSDEDGSPVPNAEYLDAVELRLVVLEKSLSELDQMSGQGTSEHRTLGEDAPDYSTEIEALRARIDAVEQGVSANSAETKALAAQREIIKEPVLLPPFPRAAMLELMTASQSAEGQGWVGKTLKKHISVRNPQEVARANEALDAIEAAAARADYTGALTQISALPSQVRSAASDWTAALEREVGASQTLQAPEALGEQP